MSSDLQLEDTVIGSLDPKKRSPVDKILGTYLVSTTDIRKKDNLLI